MWRTPEVEPLLDNSPKAQYFYQVIVYTGKYFASIIEPGAQLNLRKRYRIKNYVLDRFFELNIPSEGRNW